MNKENEKNKERAQQEALATLGMYTLERNDLEAIMERAIDLSCIILHLDCAVIFSLDKEPGTLRIGAQAGCANMQDPLSAEEKWDIGYAIRNDKPTIVESYNDDDRFSISPFLEDEDIESSVNIIVKGMNDTYGLLGFYSREKRVFTDHEINFLQIVANMVGMAIERDNHQNDLRERNKQLENEMKRSREFQREILKNSVTQQWQFGSFLHDNLAQLLASAKIMVNQIDRKLKVEKANISAEILELNTIFDESVAGIRNFTEYIIPVEIEEEGVASAYRSLIKQSEEVYDINCNLQTASVIDEIKNIEVATNLYHIIQEAIKNAATHGQADNVTVSMSKLNADLILRIEDDGIGFKHTSAEKNGKGLRIIAHRIDLMGGSFEIENKPESGNGNGTIVSCIISHESLAENGAGLQELEDS